MKLGIEVKDPGTRDENGKLRGLIRDARQKAESRKARKKAKAETEEVAAE